MENIEPTVESTRRTETRGERRARQFDMLRHWESQLGEVTNPEGKRLVKAKIQQLRGILGLKL